MDTPLDSTLLSTLHRCDDCGKIITDPNLKLRCIVENLHVPLCAHCHAQRAQSLDGPIHVALAEHLVREAHALLDLGYSFAPQVVRDE